MASDIGQTGLEYLAKTRRKRLCTLVAIEFKEMYDPIYLTDHDRPLTHEGTTYLPISIASIAFDRREGGFRSGLSQGFGLIDGQKIMIADVAGGKYRGAQITTRIVDWKLPWIILSHQKHIVSSIKWTRTSWTAVLENLTLQMQREKAGRFKGAFSARCPYILGGKYCKKDLTGLSNKSIEIASIAISRQAFLTTGARWENTRYDAFFREGEFQFLFGIPELESQITSGISIGATTLTDTSQSWTTDEHVGKWVRVLNGTGSWAVEYAPIIANTNDTLTIWGAGFEAGHSSGKFYDICPKSHLAGHVVPIANYFQSTGRIELFFPLRIELPIGHSGVLRPGCDGLFGTCKDVFSNPLNFGGLDVNAPSPADIIRPPEDE